MKRKVGNTNILPGHVRISLDVDTLFESNLATSNCESLEHTMYHTHRQDESGLKFPKITFELKNIIIKCLYNSYH